MVSLQLLHCVLLNTHTPTYLNDSLFPCQSNGHMSLSGGDPYQERLTRLESDKESLVLQVVFTTHGSLVPSRYCPFL